MKETWTTEENSLLRANLGKLTIPDLAKLLDRSETAVTLYIHRNRIALPSSICRNLLLEMLKMKLTDPECFTPTKKFYSHIKISQKRYWSIYRGEANMTQAEYLKFAEFFKISLIDAFEMRQLNLFEDQKSCL